MLGVLVGFAIICSVILVGYLVELAGILGPEGRATLNKFTFFVANPALLFTVLASADIAQLFTGYILVALLVLVIAFLLYSLISALVFRRPVAETAIAAGAASFVNGNNIGLPVAIYVLGGPEYAIPVMLVQVVLATPVLLTVLDTSTQGRTSVGRLVLQPLKNPTIVASALGVLVAATRTRLPEAVIEPFSLIGASSIPLVLIAFGMSLRGQKPFQAGTGRAEVALASGIKLLVMPVVAWLLGVFVFGLAGHELYAAVICAALPTAQNIYVFASRYERAMPVARDTVLATTVLSIPLLVLIAWMFGA